jgi:hypothetical protein
MERRTNIQTVARLVGLVFLVVGVAGFIPGITTNLYDGLEFAGHDGDAELLGIFQVSVLHNIVHLLFGFAGLALSRTISGSRTFLVGGGAIYLLLWLYGLIIDRDSDANFVPLDSADNWLHFGLGVAMITLGLLLSRERRTQHDTTAPEAY